ncbi:hypothetical protein EED79_04115 [Neisseria gonorrhoeae]|nr:hypothetical protein A6J46_07895 [Neisseria gonorrhoeae]AZG69796.1 hypothetical protein EGH16_05135 [Neisseria gonorrhoeae]OHZ70398.1 hypothetical protein BB003_04340 [Neisseria gonorrhoeae]OIA68205.1 hypothetical protein BB035_04120 [Neisseria gonorrhoeae]OIA72883.1 hypothetical protein BB041_09405 [Neisseria gonorrhoeae]
MDYSGYGGGCFKTRPGCRLQNFGLRLRLRGLSARNTQTLSHNLAAE